MIAVKEARLAKEKFGDHIEAAIFYMDMRAAGLPYQRFCDQARNDHHIRFERARVHSVIADPASGNPVLRHVALDGQGKEESFDLVVLAAGQRAAAGTAQLAESAGIALNPWGFIQHQPLSLVGTDNPGVMVAGSCTGLKDINESVIQASAAALSAGNALHNTGGSLGVESTPDTTSRDVASEPPRTLVALCTCDGGLNQMTAPDLLKARLDTDPSVAKVRVLDRLCTADGWQTLEAEASELCPNRILIGACNPYAFAPRLKALAARTALAPRLVEAVDLRIHSRNAENPLSGIDPWSAISTALARLKNIDPRPMDSVPVIQRALVVGGGIAGMQAALSIADRGYPVDLVEKGEGLGGNLRWLGRTIEGLDLQTLLADTTARVEKHPHISVHLNTEVKGAYGQVGRFYATFQTEGEPPVNTAHGAVVLATGGGEALTHSFGYGTHPSIITQKKFEMDLAGGAIAPEKLSTVAMILCVDSRQEPRNYCSRVCCPTAIKHAMAIKKANPETSVYVLYRDIMTCGFTETYFTQARQAGVVFMAYDVGKEPVVKTEGDGLVIATRDPVLNAPVEIQTDLVVLATGITPELPADLAALYGAKKNPDGFFEPADFKWRPVDALAEGIFACGIVLGPRNVAESVATAQAAAQRALRILTHAQIRVDTVVAQVRHSLCSLCERCIDICPYDARGLSPEGDKIIVNPVMCQGCGACAAACPNGAAIINGFGERQMLDTIDSVLAG